MDEFITLTAFAKSLGVSVRHLQREVDRGKLIVCKFGKAVRVAVKDAETYIRQSKQGAVT